MAYYEASIDDNDPGFIYSGGWELVTQDGDWRGTMHSTSIPGSYARVRFTGSRVAAVFTIPTGDGNLITASFSIDNGPAVTRSRATTGPVQWNYLLFDSGPLPYGNHLLVFTDIGKDGYLRIDRIDYDPTPNSAPQTTSHVASKTTTTTVVPPPATVVVTSSPTNTTPAAVAPSSTPNTTSPTGTGKSAVSASGAVKSPSSTPDANVTSLPLSVAASSSPLATPTSPLDANAAANDGTATHTKSSSHNAAIIGGVLGAVVVILLILLGLFVVRRRRKGARAFANGPTDTAPNTPANTTPTPFDMRGVSSTHLVSRGHMVSPSQSGTDYSSPTSDMYTSGHPTSMSLSASLSTQQRPDVAFDSTMMASSKHAEHLQEGHGQTSVTSPGASSGYASYGTNPQRLSVFTDYVPPPAYQ